MYFYSTIIFILNIFLLATNAQRVPPGVPPQHYENQQQYHHQQQPPQQYAQQQQYGQPQQAQFNQQVPQQQQVPVQHQQVPVQHQQQQVPVQHQQQQVPVQHQQQHQVPVNQQAHHHNHGHPQQVLNTANVAQEAEHMAEHLHVPIDTSKMSEQELQFHYFKMHDADNNNKLDGCELIKSLIHWHGSDDKPSMSDQEIANLIDDFLKNIDKNNDGFIAYEEYKKYISSLEV